MGMQYIEISPEQYIEKIADDDIVGKKLALQILNEFQDNGLTYKVKTNDNMQLRAYCYIKKSKEAMILGTRGYKSDGTFEIQIRILDKTTFNKLDEYSDSVRNWILSAPRNCRAPHCCNCGSEYKFIYQEKEYQKCHMLCDNFIFHHLNEEDIPSIMDIVRREIVFGKPKRK